MNYALNPSRKRSEPPRHRLQGDVDYIAYVFWLTSIPREVTAGVFLSRRYNSMRSRVISSRFFLFSEMLGALGLQEHVVGVDYYTNYPATLMSLPKVFRCIASLLHRNSIVWCI